MSRISLALIALASGCSRLPEQNGAVLEGFKYGWELFNHRISTLHVVAGESATEVSVIGGTSTTNETPELADTCDPELCDEFPFNDNALVDVWWSTLATRDAALVPMTISLEVGRDGASGEASGVLPDKARGDGYAILTGLSLRTDHPLSDGSESCYNPRYGWHPRQIAVSLGDVAITGDKITVPVDAIFSAGKSFEEARTCVDEVNTLAMVALDVHLLAVIGPDSVETQTLSTEASYPFEEGSSPPEQAEIAPTSLPFGIEDPLLGFSRIDFQFDPDRTDDRGAYIRTVGA